LVLSCRASLWRSPSNCRALLRPGAPVLRRQGIQACPALRAPSSIRAFHRARNPTRRKRQKRIQKTQTASMPESLKARDLQSYTRYAPPPSSSSMPKSSAPRSHLGWIHACHRILQSAAGLLPRASRMRSRAPAPHARVAPGQPGGPAGTCGLVVHWPCDYCVA
jgi:hypothetical protein